MWSGNIKRSNIILSRSDGLDFALSAHLLLVLLVVIELLLVSDLMYLYLDTTKRAEIWTPKISTRHKKFSYSPVPYS